MILLHIILEDMSSQHLLLESPLSSKASLHVHLNIICENLSNQCHQWSLTAHR